MTISSRSTRIALRVSSSGRVWKLETGERANRTAAAAANTPLSPSARSMRKTARVGVISSESSMRSTAPSRSVGAMAKRPAARRSLTTSRHPPQVRPVTPARGPAQVHSSVSSRWPKEVRTAGSPQSRP